MTNDKINGVIIMERKFFGDKLYKVLDLLNQGVIITDSNATVLYTNPAFEKFSGISSELMVGEYLQQVRLGSVLPSVLESKKSIYNLPRKVGEVESYCDLIPIIIDDILVGGIVIVRDILEIMEISKQLEESHKKYIQLDERIKSTFVAQHTFENTIGSEHGLKKTIEVSVKASKTCCPVLLLGESGTGKEVLAQSIHNASERRNMPFVGINCSAIPVNLLESELFGYDSGAFSGANKTGKLGLFEIANKGTIFLDEIAEMPLQLQMKLLRVIEEKKILKLGGENYIDIDVRIIGATNKDINSMINKGVFREDLYFRLAVFVINIPPLRERKSDIPLLVEKFLNDQIRIKKHNISISKDVMELLISYNWPGNARELKNVIDYSSNVMDDYSIKAKDLPLTLLRKVKLNKEYETYSEGTSLEDKLSKIEKDIIMNHLKIYGHDVEAKKLIALELGISIATLYNKIKKHDINM